MKRLRPSLMGLLDGQIAVVTGASQGIGLAIAQVLAANGASVVLVSRSRGRLLRAARRLSSRARLLTVRADVSRPGDVARLFARVRQKFGRLDILVNNAGSGRFVPLQRLSLSEWKQTLATNLTGTFLCAQAATRWMRQRRHGHIVNIISVAGKEPFHDMAAYCASKFGALGFTRVLAEEVRGHGIRVTAILPGATDSPFWRRAPFKVDRRKMIRPEEVARAVLAAVTAAPDTTFEEIVLRPSGGNAG